MAIHVMDSNLFGIDFIAPEIRNIFEEKAVVESWLLFESILAEVQAEMGIISPAIAQEIKKKATLQHIPFGRIVEIYRKTKLASVAVIRALAEACENGAGEYVHLGSCTPELFENTLAYRLGKAMAVFEKDLREIRIGLNLLADRHRRTIMAERSHGQQALPITFGLVAAIWSDAVAKQMDRLQEAEKRILQGSIKGAVGTFASHYAIGGEKCLEMEKRVLARLGLSPNRISFRRHIDRLTEFMNLMALLAVTFEKICEDIFTQQRNEIGELEEPFDTAGQIGSSTLPQKRNPVLCEVIMAWAKKIRSNAAAFADTHMRESHDIVGFYMEDLIIPETCMMVGGMLTHAKHIFQNLTVKADAMRRNLDQSGGLIMTEALMIALTAKTGKKQTAHHLIHLAAMESFETGMPFDQCLMKHQEISKHFTVQEIQKALDPANYLGLSDRCIDEVIKS